MTKETSRKKNKKACKHCGGDLMQLDITALLTPVTIIGDKKLYGCISCHSVFWFKE